VVLLSILTIFLALLAFAQIDFQMVLFLRSLQIPVLEHIGNVGNWLGHGETLIIFSVGVFLIGYLWKKETWRLAGLDGLMAHAIAGIVVQIPKHLIGRPRPRWAHQDAFEFGPSFQGGLDAFPSGHSAASFAVAAVMARYYPRGTWLWYGAAFFVAVSRVVRGSHFLTDALAGATLGFLVGYVCARPFKNWKASLLQAFPRCLPLLVVSFSLVWVACQKPDPSSVGPILQGMGFLVCLIGIGLRVFVSLEDGTGRKLPLSTLIVLGNTGMLLGVVMVSQSMLILSVVVLGASAWWINHEEAEAWKRPSRVGVEMFHSGIVLTLLLILHQIQGFVPLL